MTKVDAIKNIMSDNGGVATWKEIYDNIEKYYPNIKSKSEWEAGIRGVLYRELKEGKSFKKIGVGIFSLIEYLEKENIKEIKKDTIRMHSYMEGIMVELGNYEKYSTYCADPNATFRENIKIKQLTTISSFPNFTYKEINDVAKRIDVVWFSNKGYLFPKRVIEIVDSIGTIGESLSRMYQLNDFNTDFYVLTPAKHIGKIEKILDREPYSIQRKRFVIKNYDEAISYYQARITLSQVQF